MTKQYKTHKKKHNEVYNSKKVREKWEEFEREYWKKHPDKKYCHACGEKRHVELHHIIPRHVDPSKIFDEDNLIPLCRACHFRFGHLCDWENYNPHIREDAQMIRSLLEKRKREGGGDELVR